MTPNNTKKIIEKILSIRKDLTLGDVESLVRDKKKKYSGYLSDEGAGHLVAQDLLVELNERKEIRDEVQIKDLVPGLNDVTVLGRVIIAWPPHSFVKKDGSSGLMVKLLIADKTGTIQCIVWDPKDPIIKTLKTIHGNVLKIFHAYTKRGLSDNIELHIGSKASLSINPSTIRKEELPNFDDFFTPIANIREGDTVNIRAKIKEAGSIIAFKKFNREGKVLKVKAYDQSGHSILLAWDEQSEKIRKTLQDTFRVMNCRVKINSDGEKEIHVGKYSVIISDNNISARAS